MRYIQIIGITLMFIAMAGTAQPAANLAFFPVAQQSLLFVPNPEPEIWWKDALIVKALQLIDAQIGRIDEKYQKDRRELDSLDAEIRKAQEKVNDAGNAKEFDPQKSRVRMAPIVQLNMKLFSTKSRMQYFYQKELSEEQRQLFQKTQKSQTGNKPKLFGSFFTMGRNFLRTASGEPVVSSAEVQVLPKIVHNPMPMYTNAARSKRIEGIVVLAAVVNKEGRVQEVKIIRGLGYGLDESAANTITQKWLFTPGMKDGKPANVESTIEMTFKIF